MASLLPVAEVATSAMAFINIGFGVAMNEVHDERKFEEYVRNVEEKKDKQIQSFRNPIILYLPKIDFRGNNL